MDKAQSHSIKKNRKKNNKRRIKNQKNNQNDTEEKYFITTENELANDFDNFKDLSNTYKNLGFLISNKLQSLENSHENDQTLSNFIKKQNNLNNLNLIIENNFPKQQPDLRSIMKSSVIEKSNEVSNQSISLLLKKDTNNCNEENFNNHLNNNQKDINNKSDIMVTNSSKNIRKKTIAKLSLNSSCSSSFQNSQSSKKIIRRNLFSPVNSNKTKNNKKVSFSKYESQIKNSCFYDEKHSQNKPKRIKKTVKCPTKKSLSNDNFNNYRNKIRTTKSLKTPKNLINISPKFKQRKNNSTSSMAPLCTNKNVGLNFKYESNYGSNSKKHVSFRSEKKNKLQRKKRTKVTFSNFLQLWINNYKTSNKKKLKPKTFITSNKIKEENLYTTILLSNLPTEIRDANKIVDLITMDEAHKQIKETIYQYDKKELIKEIHDLETNEICEEIDKLPINNNSFISNDNKLNYNNNEDNINESNKAKYLNTRKFEKINNDSFKTRLSIFNDKYRILSHKELLFDSLDDEEMEEIEINHFYIAPNSITGYIIDSIILISSLIQLLYLPLFLAYNLKFCRNIFSIHQLMFYLIDLFYIIDLITGFFRAYYNFDEFLIRERNKICKNYLKNWFFIDFIEAIPLYIIFNRMENECKDNDIYFSHHYNKNIHKFQYILLLIKIFKIFKIISTNTVLGKLKSKLNDYDIFLEYEIVLYTIFVFFSSLNISSCIFIFLGRNSYPGWIIECNIQNYSFVHIYLASLYYLMTSVTTVGYGDMIMHSIVERIYQIIILIVGTCAYSWAITYISNYIKKIQEKSINLAKKISILKDIKLSNENFSTELYDKIYRYLQYNRVDKNNINEILIDNLPYQLNNDLYMEMYKNITRNFNFFKNIDNTNFIVKVVSSLKPVLYVKNDIIIQEGDYVEDVIFVKEGVLSLEVCIHLYCVQESIESYLKGGFGQSTKIIKEKINKKIEAHLNSNKKKFNSTELKFNKISTNFNKEKETNKINKKYLRIIDIRKNEYYGDILMFLNEQASLRAKVKSKKAELFYLNKTDAIEISTLYPNIWKKIIEKSLFNMNQIKNLTKKILIYFSKSNGISLNQELCKDLNNSDPNISKSNFIKDSQITENTNKSSISRSKEDENEIQNNINIDVSSVIYEEENEYIESPLTSTAKRNIQNSNFCNNKIGTNYNVSKNNIKNINNDLQLKFKADIEKISKENNIGNSKTLVNKKLEKLPERNNITSFSGSSKINKYCCSTPNENEINSEIYSNEKFNDNIFLQSDFSKSNKNYIDKEKSVDKKLILKYIDDEFDLNDESENKSENGSHSLNINDKKTLNFKNLSIENTITTTISSIYENLNQISKYKFSNDINLRKKTIQFLIEESNKMSSNNSIFDSNIITKTKINNSLHINQNSKKRPNTISKRKIKSKNSNNDEEDQSIISLSKDELFSESKDMKFIYQMKGNSSKFSKGNLRYPSQDPIKSNITSKKNNGLLKPPNFHRSMKNLNIDETEKLFENTKKKNSKRKGSIENFVDSPEDQELNFYGKMKSMRVNKNKLTINNINKDLLKNVEKNNYLDVISRNISEDRKTLNNPQEFYTGFFTNIVQKKINKRRRSCKIRKEFGKKKSEEVNENKISNYKCLFDNNDKAKIKNINIIKRPNSTSNIIKETM